MNDRILKSIKTLVLRFMDTACYDKTFPSVICDKSNNKYTIIKDGQKYEVTNAINIDLNIGQLVWVKIPCGRLHCMHICGLR